MLSIEKINFPITFKNCANGKNITYNSEHGNGVWSDGWKSSLSLKFFINLHNEHNQSNSNVLRYYYEMAENKTMLKVDEIIYPITFDSYGVGKFKFTSRNNGFKTDLLGRKVKYNGSVDHFVDQNNRFNPNNIPAKDYYYTMAEKKDHNDTIDSIGYLFANTAAARFNCSTFTASINAKDYDYICDVELMPVGAILVGIQRECGEWDDLKLKPRRIEVHDDAICLLSGYSGCYKSGKNYGAEINIKRGTKVKIKNSTNC